METTTAVETITVPLSDYRHLVEISTAADVFVRTGTADALEELRDATLMRVSLID